MIIFLFFLFKICCHIKFINDSNFIIYLLCFYLFLLSLSGLVRICGQNVKKWGLFIGLTTYILEARDEVASLFTYYVRTRIKQN